MSTLKINRTQFGQSNTATNNFTLTAEAADGTMKLARGNAGNTTQDIITIASDGTVNFPAGLATAYTPIGAGQTWQNLTGSRVVGTTYTNSTGRTICISLQATMGGTTGFARISVGSTSVAYMSNTVPSNSVQNTIFAIVPSGATYVVTSNSIINVWAELR